MKFDIVREEPYSLDFVKDNLEYIFSCLTNRNDFFKSTVFFHDKKIFIENLFDSSGLMTSGTKSGFHFELSNFWEGFAEFILQKDFKFYKKDYVFDKKGIDGEFRDGIIKFNLFNEEIEEVESRLRDKEENILCDILKQKYEFKHKPHEIVSIQIMEKNGAEFYTIPFKKFVFLIPENEVDKSDIRMKWNYPKHDLQEFQELTPTTIGTTTLRLSTSVLLISLLTPNERTEYHDKCIETQEYTELKIKRAENISNAYKFVLEKNNIMLSAEDSYVLVECFIAHSMALDLFGIKKPTASSSFLKPFYFIEVKTTNSKFGHLNLSALQESFLEKAKDKFGILIINIKVEPNEAVVRFLVPK